MPKKTLDLILSLGCHFLVQLKLNCSRLYSDIALYTALSRPITSCQYYEDHHGYQVNRRIELYTNRIEVPKGWNGIERIAKVRRWGIRQNKPFHHVAFYILSKPIDSAALVAQAIQGHWSIENQLHWIKDVNLGEDDTTLRDPNSVAVLAYLNNAAINILKTAGYKPIKDNFAKFANKVNELIKLFECQSQI